jgi:hypothetical protein
VIVVSGFVFFFVVRAENSVKLTLWTSHWLHAGTAILPHPRTISKTKGKWRDSP